MTQPRPAFDLDPIAREVARVTAAITENEYNLPTPCQHYSVADLLDHLLGLTFAFRCAAEKSDLVADAAPSGSAERLDPDWRNTLRIRLDELVAAWRKPGAWEGEATAGGVTMPGSAMATVVMDELVLHGWDLARATGQSFEPDAVSAQVCLEFTTASSEPGVDRGGLFGPVVAVPDNAPVFQRALGLSGRDPGWTPAT